MIQKMLLKYYQYFIKAKITRGERYRKLKAKEILGSTIPLKIEGNSEHIICSRIKLIHSKIKRIEKIKHTNNGTWNSERGTGG